MQYKSTTKHVYYYLLILKQPISICRVYAYGDTARSPSAYAHFIIAIHTKIKQCHSGGIVL